MEKESCLCLAAEIKLYYSLCYVWSLKFLETFAPFQVFRGEMNCAKEMLHYYVVVCWPRSVTFNENFTYVA